MRRLVALASAAGTVFLGLAPAGPAQGAVPGPNGQIVFSRSVSATTEDFRVVAANPDGSHLQRVSPYALECPHWSPDGSLIITCGGPKGAIALIINPDTGHTRFIFSPDPTLFITCPIMSPDTKRLLCDQFDQPADTSRNGIYSIRSSDGRGLQRITSNPGGHDAPGDYSPDGRQIVFARIDPTRAPKANQALFVVNVDGAAPQRITPWGLPGVEAAGSWSPDGKLILFGGHGSIYVVHPDGTGLAQIPLAGISGFSSVLDDPTWSPDGSKFAFALFGRTSPATSIFTANADGSDVQQVTSAPIFDAHPDWGPHPLAA